MAVRIPLLLVAPIYVILPIVNFLSHYLVQIREFCAMVRKIFICTKEEVQKMNPGSLHSKAEEISSADDEGTDAN